MTWEEFKSVVDAEIERVGANSNIEVDSISWNDYCFGRLEITIEPEEKRLQVFHAT